MERLRSQNMPTFEHIKNDEYVSQMRQDTFALFRAPDKFNRDMIMTNVDMNAVYNCMINNILQALIYIWKCSGMDLAHPSYTAPPGTIIVRESIREALGAEGIGRPALHPVTETEEVTPPPEKAGPPAPGTPVPTPGTAPRPTPPPRP